jgi:hypothetical protein
MGGSVAYWHNAANSISFWGNVLGRKFLAGTVIAATLLAAMPSGFALGAECAREIDQVALRTRAVQTDFMVAALSCDEKDHYNSFVKKFQPQLIRQGKNLQAYYKRAHGQRGTTELNSLLTKLANLASTRSIADRAGFCGSARERMSEALLLKAKDFPAFIDRQPFIPVPGVTFCTTEAAKTP